MFEKMKSYPHPFCLLVVVVAMGCGGPKWPVHYKCELPLTTVWFEYEPNCDVMQQNLYIAEAVFRDHGLMTTQDFWSKLRDVPIYVYEMDYLWREGDGHYTGGQFDGGAIHMEANGLVMAHEMLHVKDFKNWQPGTINHENWERNGYNEAAQDFAVRGLNLWYYSPDNPRLSD